MNLLSTTLKKIIKRKKLSESELARQTGISQSVISRIISNKTNPKISSLKAIAKYLNVSLDELMGDTQTTHVPVISLEDAKNWPQNKGTLSLSRQILVDTKTHLDIFAIELAEETKSPFFPKGTIAIIAPHVEYQDEDYVAVFKEEQKSLSFQRLQRDNQNHKILGTLIRAQIDYKQV